MKIIGGTILATIILLASAGTAESDCPLLNRATASGVLGGKVSQQIHASSTGKISCMFGYQDGKVESVLTLTVFSSQDPHQDVRADESSCSSAARQIQGIGNSADICRADNRASWGEQVVGRVRDKVFVIYLRTRQKTQTEIPRARLTDNAIEVAEHVAGDLF